MRRAAQIRLVRRYWRPSSTLNVAIWPHGSGGTAAGLDPWLAVARQRLVLPVRPVGDGAAAAHRSPPGPGVLVDDVGVVVLNSWSSQVTSHGCAA